jgi:branched-chain amino acid transport system substrate-binding protein/urea transport system substrate-binding protein
MHGDDTVVSFYVMTHYDALMALKAGLEKSGEVSREAAVDGMAGLTYEVPTGSSTITPEDHHSALKHVHLEDGGRPDQRGRTFGPDRAGQAVRVRRRALSA